KAILWDNDGVLVDTERFYFEASRAALVRLGVAFDEAIYVDHCLRHGASCFDLARAQGVSETAITAARAERDAHYAELISAVELIPGVRETLESLYGRVPMAVVTSSHPEHFELQHARTGARRFFEFVLTGADYTRSKPDPEPYLLAAERIGVAPADCLAVEDSERGLVAATRAGMRCAVIPRWLSASGNFDAAWRVLPEIGRVPELFADW
ncbi:MAG TPA: HAD family phosphatase, partial [Myxococcota bacterium]|nr:HAD family phosphatase [Myxococcota bacterium]